MSLSYQPTPAAMAREAERLQHMARRAADCPAGYTPEGWAARCQRLARELEQRAART